MSPPVTFTIVQPGDRDHDGILDDEDNLDGSKPPVPGKSVVVKVVSGEVFIKFPAGKGPRAVTPPAGFVPLKGAANIPIGSQLDTANGRVALTSAADTGGKKTQTSDFYDGIFQVKQSVPKKKPKKAKALITDLVLKGEPPRSQCAPQKGARSAGANKKKGPQGGPRSAVGQRQGQVPDVGQVQLGDGARDDLARPGSLRGHADQGLPRHGPGGGLPAQQDGVREGRPQLPRARGTRGEQESREEVTWGRA